MCVIGSTSHHCDALWQVLTRGRSGETYIGGNADLSNKDIVSLICEIVDGLSSGPTRNSKALIHYVKDRQGHDRRYAVDCAKIKRELGWVPSHTIHGGLHKTVEWYMR
jgi:dTDP-glucose 4,6-dehydratase